MLKQTYKKINRNKKYDKKLLIEIKKRRKRRRRRRTIPIGISGTFLSLETKYTASKVKSSFRKNV